MSYFLIATILVALIAIFYVWYITRGLNSIPDDKPIPLETDDDKLLIHWYKMHIKQSYDFSEANTNDSHIASRFLKRIYNIEVNPDFLILGTDLDTQYFRLTHHHLNTKYLDSINKDTNELESSFSPDIDYIFDLRSTIGKCGEIAIVNNPRIRGTLQRSNTLDFSEISLIINSELETVANDYLREVLKFRWDHILQLNDPSILNRFGSYIYLRTSDDIIPGLPVQVLGNRVTALMTPQGARLNLLCSNYEFEALIKRWKEYLATPSPLNI